MPCDSVREEALSIAGRWVRASRYELGMGFITPARNSRCEEYDPWSQFIENCGKYRTVEQPYVPLLNLGRMLRETHSEAANQAILKWCTEHGLLGLLPTQYITIELPAKLTRDYGWPVVETPLYIRQGEWKALSERTVFLPQNEVTRFQQRHGVDLRNSARLLHLDAMGDPAGAEEMIKHDAPQAFFSFGGFGNQLGLADLHRSFFPTVAKEDVSGLPLPNSVEFWPIYSEQTVEFRQAVEFFTHHVTMLSNPSSQVSIGGRWSLEEAQIQLSAWASAVAVAYRFPRSTVDEIRSSPGLLASYALMYLWDLKAGRRVLTCGNCGQYFVSDEHRAKYCSPRCRNTAQTRRFRAKKKRSKSTE